MNLYNRHPGARRHCAPAAQALRYRIDAIGDHHAAIGAICLGEGLRDGATRYAHLLHAAGAQRLLDRVDAQQSGAPAPRQ